MIVKMGYFKRNDSKGEESIVILNPYNFQITLILTVMY
jgi:hypothetical protein